MSKKAVIVSGGTIDEKTAESVIAAGYDELIGVDSGLDYLFRMKHLPTYIVGDFDSVNEAVLTYYRKLGGIDIREFDPVKDASDTEIALHMAAELGCSEAVLVGATGSRLDHVWANIQALCVASQAGIKAVILDANNRIRLIEEDTLLKRDEAYGPYFSVFPLGQSVEHFSISGAKYPLQDHTLMPVGSLCVSNQFAKPEVRISFPAGRVILMETRD